MGVDGCWCAPRSSKPLQVVRSCPGGFDSHILSPTGTGAAALLWFLCISTPQSNLRFASSPAGEPFGNVANSTQKLSPFTGKVSRRSRDERGTARRCRAILLFPLSFAYAQQLPHKWWRLLVRFTNSYVKPALKGEVDMSVSEWTEGLHQSCCCLS